MPNVHDHRKPPKTPSIKQTRGFPGGAAKSTNQSPSFEGKSHGGVPGLEQVGKGEARSCLDRQLAICFRKIRWKPSKEVKSKEAILVELKLTTILE